MRRIAAILLSIVLIAVLIPISAASTQTATASYAEVADYVKDETVYASLNSDGTIGKVSVVNRINNVSGGIYTDYGRYSDIKNLTSEALPKMEDNKVVWELPAANGGFYYEGSPLDAELPILFTIGYTLDGKAIKPQDLAGKTGSVVINLAVRPNAKTASYFKDNYLTQIQVPLSLEKCRNIIAQGAQSVIVGETNTLAYMVFPGTSKEFSISFDTEGFEMDGIQATATAVDIKNLIGIDMAEIGTGSTELSQGTKDLVGGTEQLKKGVSELAEGLKKTASGLTKLAGGSLKFVKGLKSYTSGVNALSQNTDQISQGLSQLDQNGAALSAGYTKLSAGTIQLLDGILAGMTAEQKAAYSFQIEMMKQQLSGYGKGLDDYTKGVSDAAQGFAAVSGGLSELARQSPAIEKGAEELSEGLNTIANGLNQLYKGAATLPGEIQKLNEGQKQLSQGIDQALSMLDGFKLNTQQQREPVSFADNSRSVHSVQFVIKTAELKVPEKTAQAEPVQKPQTFWEKLAALFNW